mmetsp:Transcript_17274/g.19740  ORF Transcript_17274/g.19740 Transcript_17274/m.19740 type:complete len:420 (+) Transcript_17274:3-1262(+)
MTTTTTTDSTSTSASFSGMFPLIGDYDCASLEVSAMQGNFDRELCQELQVQTKQGCECQPFFYDPSIGGMTMSNSNNDRQSSSSAPTTTYIEAVFSSGVTYNFNASGHNNINNDTETTITANTTTDENINADKFFFVLPGDMYGAGGGADADGAASGSGTTLSPMCLVCGSNARTVRNPTTLLDLPNGSLSSCMAVEAAGRLGLFSSTYCSSTVIPLIVDACGGCTNRSSSSSSQSCKSACLLEVHDTEESRKVWPHKFSCRCSVRIEDDDQLCWSFLVKNTSVSSPFDFTCGVHTYFHTSDVDQARITGPFKECTKLNRTVDPPEQETYQEHDVRITAFTDDIYREVLPGTVTLHDGIKSPLRIVSAGGWQDIVVWNPYGNSELGYKSFVCIESVASRAITLQPEDTWSASVTLIPAI